MLLRRHGAHLLREGLLHGVPCELRGLLEELLLLSVGELLRLLVRQLRVVGVRLRVERLWLRLELREDRLQLILGE